ncbi:stress responsive protein [Devosia epidermidihirudinis]|uniref:Stress responsive protein n=1 Tax=Devosia epidermidihirudinis TaxID=1293439 RepID=A0A0F5QFB6_9HYPH|nr:Dabb family protein [Devosia epidermidihirudinis]KKC39630.1 stress responsive protein [Devosia epidermidihirudinis]
MIRHCVFLKFRDDVATEEREAIYAGLNALVGQIDGLLRADFGPNVSPEGLGQGFKDGFIMDLADAAARDRYLVDPAHQAAGARLVAALEGGVAGLLVFDLDVAD